MGHSECDIYATQYTCHTKTPTMEKLMAKEGTLERPKYAGAVNTTYVNANSKRIQKDEEELEALIKRSRGEADEPEDEEEDEAPAAKEGKEPAKKAKEAPAPESEAVDDEPEPTSQEEKVYKKRYADACRHINKLKEQVKALEEGVKSNTVNPPKSEADVKAWMEKYPDVAAIVEAIAEKKAAEKFASADERLRKIDEQEQATRAARAEAEIKAVHKDWDDIRESDAFHDWAESQPRWITDALYENEDDPVAVIKVVNLYKLENGLDVKGKKESQKKAVTAVVTKRTRTEVDAEGANAKIRESEVHKMSAAEYERRADEIAEAIRTGNFIYDMSNISAAR